MTIDLQAIYLWIVNFTQSLTTLWEMFQYSLVDTMPMMADRFAVIYGSDHPSVFICGVMDKIIDLMQIVCPFLIPLYNYPVGEVMLTMSIVGIFVLFIYKLII